MPDQSQSTLADLNPKKRKREFSMDEADGQPSTKQSRSESPVRDVEDLPLSEIDAHKILTILEVVDTEGLLDRLLTYPDAASPRVTVRSLLQGNGNYSLRFIRSALNQVLPAASQPRALLAIAASNQQRFVDFTHSLFNEIVARKVNSEPAKKEEHASDDDEEGESSLPVEDRKRKYALLQRLPTGDWWSSVTIPKDGDVGLTRAAAKALATRQSELVSIIPSQPIPPEDMPTFATLRPTTIPFVKSHEDRNRKASVTLPNRTLPAPTLLDYGVYSTFAPAFNSENAEIGVDQIHQLVHESLMRRKARALRKQLLEKQQRMAQTELSIHRPAIEAPSVLRGIDEQAVADLEKDDAMEVEGIDKTTENTMDPSLSLETAIPSDEVLQNLQNVIPQDEADILKQAFEALRLEFGISDLLEHIAIGLNNLVDLQRQRLREGSIIPGDLEREIANAVQSSLSLCISLRPRTSSKPDASLVPSMEILRTLQRSLPATPLAGYRGTLQNARTMSLRDDSTMYVKATAKAQAAAASAAAVGTPQVNGTPRVPTTPTPSTPISQAPQYHTPPFHNNPNPMMYGYAHGPSPGMAGGAMPPTMGGATRVMPNLLTPKGVPLTPGGQWQPYAAGMPPYMGKGPPMTPVRQNPAFYKQ